MEQNLETSDENPMLAWVSLVHASSRLTQGLDAALQEDVGISMAEQDLLKQIAVNQGALTLTELARRIFLSKAGMTKMLDRLEKQGLLKRAPAPGDRRSLRVALTAKGRRILKRSQEVLLAYVAENMTAHLSTRQVKQLNQSLRAVLDGHGVWEGQIAHLKGEAND